LYSLTSGSWPLSSNWNIGRELRALAEEKILKHYICVSLDPRPRKVGDISVLPWKSFLGALWAGEYR
ncbi:MAG TPA: hypothetical protein VF371_01160, partial [Candidatus Limnocylindrales bacterium]